MADGDGIGSKIIGALEDVGEAAGEELKKFGKSATSQITGSSGQGDSNTNSKLSNSSLVPPTDKKQKPSEPHSFMDEVKKIGEDVVGQVSGHEVHFSKSDISKMKKDDDEFSKAEAEATRRKIKRIYEEYAAKQAQKKRQEETAEVQEEEQVQQKKEFEQQKKKKIVPNKAIEQTKAEIKNYGAE